MEEIVDRYFLSRVTTAQSLPYGNNSLSVKIAPFARGRGLCIPRDKGAMSLSDLWKELMQFSPRLSSHFCENVLHWNLTRQIIWFLAVIDPHQRRQDDLDYDALATTIRTIFVLCIRSFCFAILGAYLIIPHMYASPLPAENISDDFIKVIL